MHDNKNKLKIGWIGAGFVGQVAHLVNYADFHHVEIVGLAELRPKLGRAVSQKYGIKNLYTNHTELVADAPNKQIDCVVAIVRREHTVSVALDVLRSGLPLFTEKPMAPTVDQGRMLVDEAKKSNCLYVNGFMRRHDEGVQSARRLLLELTESNEIGQPVFFRCFCFGGGDYCNIDGFIQTDEPPPRQRILPIAPEWLGERYEREYESFVNVFSHDINLLRFLTGTSPKITSVHYGNTSGTVGLEFNNFPGVFEFAHLKTNRYWEEGVEIVFSKGRVLIELPPAFLRNQPATVTLFKETKSGGLDVYRPQADWTWAFRRQADSFIESVRTGSTNLASGEDSLEDLVLIEKIWEKIA